MGKSQNFNPHDRFFRSAMAYPQVAVEFFNLHLPEKLRQQLNFSSLRLTQNSYIDQHLQESCSDVVFQCEIAGREAYISLLVEHQSSADRMMPFRVHHYLFGMLYSHLKQHPKKRLPPVYTLVYYHGKTTPYPHSLDLCDCFDDPLQLMREVLYQPLPLVDVNQLSDEELEQQKWVGPMSLALKHIRGEDITPQMLKIFQILPLWPKESEASDYPDLVIVYLLNHGGIDNITGFLDDASEQLPNALKDKVMTFAEKIKLVGKQEGILQGKREGKQEGAEEEKKRMVFSMLREGVARNITAKISGLSVEEVQRMEEQLPGYLDA